jgi:hypothetical protein
MTPNRTAESVTLDHIRSHGCQDLLIYCDAIDCSHNIVMNADHLPAELPIRSLCRRMVCSRGGHRGADVRPDNRHVAVSAHCEADRWLPMAPAWSGGPRVDRPGCRRASLSPVIRLFSAKEGLPYNRYRHRCCRSTRVTQNVRPFALLSANVLPRSAHLPSTFVSRRDCCRAAIAGCASVLVILVF